MNAASLAAASSPADRSPPQSVARHRYVCVDGVRIFYREAGAEGDPVVLLLHGFPSSSHMYRHLIPALADRYRVVAPDYPGFGNSDFPPPGAYPYSFASFARTLDRFTQALRLERYALYVQDYGAPVGLRLALAAPGRVSALIVQNGNAYEEGLSPAWDPLKAYWRAPSVENRARLRAWLNPEGIRQQYVAGLPPALVERVSPDAWALDWERLSRPGNIGVQLDLFGDYRGNVELYPRFQQFFRERQPPALVAWGRHDPFFTVEGALAFRRDIPGAEIHLLDAGHFALETHGAEIASLARGFLERRLRR